MSYTVTLVDFPGGLAEADRTEAERRYRAALEKKLGSAENVPYHFRAFTSAAKSEDDQLTTSEAAAAAAYMVAQHEAIQAGFRGLGHSDEAYFEVRLTDAPVVPKDGTQPSMD